MPRVAQVPEPLLFELSSPGRQAFTLPSWVGEEEPCLPEFLRRKIPPLLPEVSERDLVGHFTRLSRLNFGVDVGFYPLGSCTMKYNPKAAEEAASLPGFACLHPHAPVSLARGALRLLGELGEMLGEIAGLPAVSLQPLAGAQAELLGLLMVRAYHEERGEGKRRVRVLVPDSAHGTNPASAALAGFRVTEIPSDSRGQVDFRALERELGEDVAALMLTNPNTLGIFEEGIEEIAGLAHRRGALLYGDGANANALLGVARYGDMGFDLVHFNLHKTFGTPHGSGGPGAAALAVRAELAPYLPVPVVERDPSSGEHRFSWDRPRSVGKVAAFWGNFGVLVRAYLYLRLLGAEGLKKVAESAVLHSSYLRHLLEPVLPTAYPSPTLHEFVLSAARLKRERGVRAGDLAKALLDRGFHAPTVYFPLVVEEALMIEPTETESRETLEAFARALREIVEEARREPERVRSSPHRTPVGRLDEARAAREPVLGAHPAGKGESGAKAKGGAEKKEFS